MAALASLLAFSAGQAACRGLVDDGDAAILAATVMPNHVHLLLRLGNRLTLARVIAKWRAYVRRALPALIWQANYFEHRLRFEESAEAYAWYIFMNPYCAKLISVDRIWPGSWTDGSVEWSFLESARPGPCPLPEWLGLMDEVECGLVTDGE